ncbi:MAG: 6-phosphogluconate dehydratase [Candidatus Hepatoplasma scabrum]|nr:MAG: 6-phosphogluconate dehydratase [Candidatus Hepatoplasma sp.]
MEKIGLVFDSSCGYSKEKVEKDGNFFIPLIIEIDGKKYKAGIDIDSEKILEKMKDKNIEIKTASPELQDIYNSFKKGLKIFDKLIFIGISEKFSSTQNNARVIINEYKDEFKGKVFIYKSQFSAPWTKFYYNSFKKIIDKYKDISSIYEVLDKQKEKMIGVLSPGDIYWFYKGGRITKRQYKTANILNIHPILVVKDGEINPDNVEKAFSIKKAAIKMINILKPEIENLRQKKINHKIIILSEDQTKSKKILTSLVTSIFKLDEKEIIFEKYISPEQSVHMGPGSFGLTYFWDIEI